VHRHRDLGAGPGAEHRRTCRDAAQCAPRTSARGRDPALDRLACPVAQDPGIARPMPGKQGDKAE
jgi:hypothetical protein